MIEYRAELAKYQTNRMSICERFFTDTADAEETCDNASHGAHTTSEQNAAQAALTAQIRTCARTRSDAMDSLGPPPVMPFNY